MSDTREFREIYDSLINAIDETKEMLAAIDDSSSEEQVESLQTKISALIEKSDDFIEAMKMRDLK